MRITPEAYKDLQQQHAREAAAAEAARRTYNRRSRELQARAAAETVNLFGERKADQTRQTRIQHEADTSLRRIREALKPEREALKYHTQRAAKLEKQLRSAQIIEAATLFD